MEIKNKILDKVNSVQDEDMLKEIYDWIGLFLEASNQEKFEKEEIIAVQEGYSDYLAGRTISQENAAKLFDQWLAKKEL